MDEDPEEEEEEAPFDSMKSVKEMVEETKQDMRSIKRSKSETTILSLTTLLQLGLSKSFGKVDCLTCCICMDYIVSSRTAVCGHSFCEECITESLIRKNTCPHCRKDIRRWVLQKSEIIDNAVKMLIDCKRADGDEKEADRMTERLKNHENWLEKHNVKFVKPGDKLDVLDTEHIWCSAIVELKIRAAGKIPLLHLHYEGWNRKYDEYMY